MKIIQRELGPVQANCYILIKDHHAIVIDPGDVFEELDFILKNEDCTLDAILLTHAHFDHIGGVDDIVKRTKCDVYLNPYEHDYLNDASLNASSSFLRHVLCKTKPKAFNEGILEIHPFKIECIHCPGHSIGSTVFKIEDMLFTGDVLFNASIGRTDLPGGSQYAMEKSLKVLCQFNEDFKVYPGHGPATTLNIEKKINPFLQIWGNQI